MNIIPTVNKYLKNVTPYKGKWHCKNFNSIIIIVNDFL